MIVENDTDRPWFRREHFRVDWSKNLITTAYELDTLSQLGIYYGVEVEPVAYYVNDPAHADTPVFAALWAQYRTAQRSAQGPDVGLPEGQMGNSEVGHLNLGAGAIVKQDLARIDTAVADGSFFENEALLSAVRRAADSPSGRLHLIGLVSDLSLIHISEPTRPY